MKPSNGRNATPVEFLEYHRRRSGLAHAKRLRGQLGLTWRPSVMVWTAIFSWPTWAAMAAAVLGTAADLISVADWFNK